MLGLPLETMFTSLESGLSLPREVSMQEMSKPPFNYHHPIHSSNPIYYIDPETRKSFLIIVAKSLNTSQLFIIKFDIKANKYHTISIDKNISDKFGTYVYFIDQKNDHLYVIDKVYGDENSFVCDLRTEKCSKIHHEWHSIAVEWPCFHCIKNQVHFIRSDGSKSYHQVMDTKNGKYINLANNASAITGGRYGTEFNVQFSPHSVYLPLLDKLLIFGHGFSERDRSIWELNNASKDLGNSKWKSTDIEIPESLCCYYKTCAFVVGFDSFVFLFTRRKNYCLDVINKKWHKLNRFSNISEITNVWIKAGRSWKNHWISTGGRYCYIHDDFVRKQEDDKHINILNRIDLLDMCRD